MRLSRRAIAWRGCFLSLKCSYLDAYRVEVYGTTGMPLRNTLSHLLLAVFAVGVLGCPCPAAAITGHDADTGHEHHADVRSGSPAADEDGHGQAQCKADCDRVFADSPRKEQFSWADKPPLDPEWEALEPENMAWSNAALPVSWTAPPSRRSLAQETPVRRFDRLLD